jgi:hypothetical protein
MDIPWRGDARKIGRSCKQHVQRWTATDGKRLVMHLATHKHVHNQSYIMFVDAFDYEFQAEQTSMYGRYRLITQHHSTAYMGECIDPFVDPSDVTKQIEHRHVSLQTQQWTKAHETSWRKNESLTRWTNRESFIFTMNHAEFNHTNSLCHQIQHTYSSMH